MDDSVGGGVDGGTEVVGAGGAVLVGGVEGDGGPGLTVEGCAPSTGRVWFGQVPNTRLMASRSGGVTQRWYLSLTAICLATKGHR